MRQTHNKSQWKYNLVFWRFWWLGFLLAKLSMAIRMQSGEGCTAQKSVVYFSNFFGVRLARSQLWASIQHSNQSMIAVDLFDSMVECHRILSFCGHHCYPQQYALALFWSWCLFFIRIKDVITQQDSLYTIYGWLHEAQTACRARR